MCSTASQGCVQYSAPLGGKRPPRRLFSFKNQVTFIFVLGLYGKVLVVLLTHCVGITILGLEDLPNHVIFEEWHHLSLKSTTAWHVAEQTASNTRFPPAPTRMTNVEWEETRESVIGTKLHVHGYSPTPYILPLP